MKKYITIVFTLTVFILSFSVSVFAGIDGNFGTNPIPGSNLSAGTSLPGSNANTQTQTNLAPINIPSSSVAGDPNKIPNPLGGSVNSLPAFFSAIISVVIELGTIVSVLAIMYGGFLYVTAQGDEEKLGKAYKTITWALVGTAILLGARAIMAAVTDTVKQLGSGL